MSTTQGSKEFRKDYKFETFLKRAFDSETCAKVRYYDTCVVIFQGKKDYKHIIVTDEHIYTTEDAPKSLTKILHFKDMVSIKIERDYPDFLEGDFRDSSQHLVITYFTTNKKIKPFNGTVSQKGDHGTLHSLNDTLNQTERSIIPDDNTHKGSQVEKTKVGCCGGRRATKASKTTSLPTEPGIVSENQGEIQNLGVSTENLLPPNPEELQLELTQSHVVTMTEDQVNTARMRHISELHQVKDVIHIYILNRDTPALILIKSAWNHYLLNGTLSMRTTCLDTSRSQATKVSPDPERVKYLYRQLVSDLMQVKHKIEEVFYYSNELNNAANRYFQVKRLFWTSNEIWEFYCCTLAKVLPSSNLNLILRENQSDRIDELELALLIIDVLNSMFEGTETLMERANILRLHDSKTVFALINSILPDPAVPDRKSFIDVSDDMKYHFKETKRFSSDLIQSTSALFFNILHDGRDSPASKLGNLTESGVIYYLEKHFSITTSFLHRMLTNVFEMISPIGAKPTDHLTAEQAVLLFRQFSILKTVTTYSIKFREFVMENYAEEFKYFVQAPVIMSRLSSEYPITYPTLALIAHITSLVTKASNFCQH